MCQKILTAGNHRDSLGAPSLCALEGESYCVLLADLEMSACRVDLRQWKLEASEEGKWTRTKLLI
jgi:hypothetical protein